MSVRILKHFFPKLRVVGEESTEYSGKIDLKVEDIKINDIPISSEQVPISELCIWIDPIDNTKGFIKGEHHCVTNLFGVSRKSRCYAGVVGLPYALIGEKLTYQPLLQVGLVSQSKAILKDGGEWKDITKPKLHDPLQFVISNSRGSGPHVDRLLSRFNAQLSAVGGSGKKVWCIIYRQPWLWRGHRMHCCTSKPTTINGTHVQERQSSWQWEDVLQMLGGNILGMILISPP